MERTPVGPSEQSAQLAIVYSGPNTRFYPSVSSINKALQGFLAQLYRRKVEMDGFLNEKACRNSFGARETKPHWVLWLYQEDSRVEDMVTFLDWFQPDQRGDGGYLIEPGERNFIVLDLGSGDYSLDHTLHQRLGDRTQSLIRGKAEQAWLRSLEQGLSRRPDQLFRPEALSRGLYLARPPYTNFTTHGDPLQPAGAVLPPGLPVWVVAHQNLGQLAFRIPIDGPDFLVDPISFLPKQNSWLFCRGLDGTLMEWSAPLGVKWPFQELKLIFTPGSDTRIVSWYFEDPAELNKTAKAAGT